MRLPWGSLGCGEMTPDEVREVAMIMRAGTNRPFNLNFFIPDAAQTDAAVLEQVRQRLAPWYNELGLGKPPEVIPELPSIFDDAHLALLLEIRPAVVSFHFGVPEKDAIAALKDAGIILISSATTIAEARVLEASGMDAIIAQGWEAGGHRGSHRPTDPNDGVGTFALIPQVADAVNIPIIAAGGIGDGRGIAAAFALGASGVQMGTGFLSCPEAGTDAPRRVLLQNATDTDTIVTDALSGRSARAMRSKFAEEMEQSREEMLAFRSMYSLSQPIMNAADDTNASFHLYGQAAGLNRDLPAADLFAHLVAEAAGVFERLSAG